MNLKKMTIFLMVCVLMCANVHAFLSLCMRAYTHLHIHALQCNINTVSSS